MANSDLMQDLNEIAGHLDEAYDLAMLVYNDTMIKDILIVMNHAYIAKYIINKMEELK